MPRLVYLHTGAKTDAAILEDLTSAAGAAREQHIFFGEVCESGAWRGRVPGLAQMHAIPAARMWSGIALPPGGLYLGEKRADEHRARGAELAGRGGDRGAWLLHDRSPLHFPPGMQANVSEQEGLGRRFAAAGLPATLLFRHNRVGRRGGLAGGGGGCSKAP